MSLLTVKDLGKSFGGVKAVDGISFELEAGELLALIGPNGAGKSTTFNMVNGQLQAERGSIQFAGKELVGLAPRDIWRLGVGRTFQIAETFSSLTVIENVLCGKLGRLPIWRPLLRKFSDQDITRAFDLIDSVGLSQEFASRRADALSGGQRQRVGIARALMQEPSLILADEPTSSLDPKTSVEIMELLDQVSREREVPVIVNIHNVDLARRFASRIIGMSAGQVVFDGPPDALQDTHLNEIYGGEDWQA